MPINTLIATKSINGSQEKEKGNGVAVIQIIYTNNWAESSFSQVLKIMKNYFLSTPRPSAPT